MLLCLLVADVVAIKQQVYVLVLRHLHPVAVDCDAELLVPALCAVGLDFLRRFVGYHRNRGGVPGDFGAVGQFTCDRGLCRPDSCDVHIAANLILHHIHEPAQLLIAVEGVALTLALEVVHDQDIKALGVPHLLDGGVDALLIERGDIDVGELAGFEPFFGLHDAPRSSGK